MTETNNNEKLNKNSLNSKSFDKMNWFSTLNFIFDDDIYADGTVSYKRLNELSREQLTQLCDFCTDTVCSTFYKDSPQLYKACLLTNRKIGNVSTKRTNDALDKFNKTIGQWL